MFKKIYRRISNISFFLKLILIVCFFIIISVSISGYISISSFSELLREKEIVIENEALKRLKTFTEEKITKINGIVFQMYDTKGVSDLLSNLERYEDREYDINVINTIDFFIQTVCSADKDIIDFIIVSNNNVVFSRTSLQNRVISTNYNYTDDRVFKEIRERKSLIEVIQDFPSRYIASGSEPVVSVVGNILNADKSPERESMGIYIINIPISAFKRSYNEYEKLKGEFIITNNNGNLLFSSEGKMLGEKYPYFNKIYNIKGDEVKLDKYYYVNTININNAELMVANIIPEAVMWQQVDGIVFKVIIIMLACLFFTILVIALIFNVFSKRMSVLMKYMRRVQKGDFNSVIPIKSCDEIGMLGQVYNEMCEKLQDYINKVFNAELERKGAELSALQSQINPHFLYNTLETLRMKALQDKNTELSRMLALLGNLFRWNVKTKDKIVIIEEEIEYTASYLELQKLRFQDKIDIEINIDENILNLGIPKLLLQPLVENAINHGLGMLESNGLIKIEGRKESERVVLTISDNGVGMDEETLSNVIDGMNNIQVNKDHYNIGLSNVHRRIRLIFGNDFGLDVKSKKDNGTTINITLPAKTKQEMSKYVRGFDS